MTVLRSRVSGNSGNDEESNYDPSVPADKQIVRYRTKDGVIKQVTKLELQDQLQASEKLMESLNLTWEEKMAKTAAIHIEREKALEELGISIDKDVSYLYLDKKLMIGGRGTCAAETSISGQSERGPTHVRGQLFVH